MTFGWEAVCFEVDDGSLLPSLPACLKAVESCDYCVALLGDDYGSALDAEPVSYTTREFWRALALQKPIRLYIRQRRSSVAKQHEPAFRAARLAMEDAEIGPAHGYFESLQGLQRQVKIALSRWVMDACPPGPALHVRRLIERLDRRFPARFPGSPTPRLGDPNLVSAFLERIREHFFLEDPVTADDLCHSLLRALPIWPLELPVTAAKRPWLQMWAEFLELFKWAHNCIGESDGLTGSMSLAKAVLQIYEALEDAAGYTRAVEGLAGCYYSRGDNRTAWAWYSAANGLVGSPARRLIKANVRANTARVLRSLGRRRAATRAAHDALRYAPGDEKLVGLTTGLVAALELEQGHEALGERMFAEASSILAPYPLSILRSRRIWAEALATLGYDEAALFLVSELERDCLEGGYEHQLWRLASSQSLRRVSP